jgi:hypothetical protein
MNQQIFKVKKKAAQGGHKLLKKKADALKVGRASTETRNRGPSTKILDTEWMNLKDGVGDHSAC